MFEEQLGQAGTPAGLAAVLFALAALGKAAYPFFSRWLDHIERYRPPPSPEPHQASPPTTPETPGLAPWTGVAPANLLAAGDHTARGG